MMWMHAGRDRNQARPSARPKGNRGYAGDTTTKYRTKAIAGMAMAPITATVSKQATNTEIKRVGTVSPYVK